MSGPISVACDAAAYSQCLLRVRSDVRLDHAFVDEHTIDRCCLSGIRNLPPSTRDGRLDVRVVEDDERRVAAKLETRPLQVSALSRARFAHRGGAREGELAHAKTASHTTTCAARAREAVTTFSTPAGKPASAARCASASD